MIKKILFSSTVLLFLTTAVAPAAFAQSTRNIVCDQLGQSSQGNLDCEPGTSEDLASSLVGRIINILFFVIGVAAVVIIVVAGLMYVLSGGDPNNTKRAKDAILYAVIGLIVAFLARFIVNFIITRL